MKTQIQLTQKELSVLQLLKEGKNNKEIATEMNVSVNTTKTHLSHLFRKLNVNTRIQAYIKADSFGLGRDVI